MIYSDEWHAKKAQFRERMRAKMLGTPKPPKPKPVPNEPTAKEIRRIEREKAKLRKKHLASRLAETKKYYDQSPKPVHRVTRFRP